jgi:Uma2 family endonuclease
MATTTRRLSVDDLEFIPAEREGDRHEIIDGELVVTPVPTLKHQIVSGRLIRYLDRHVDDGNSGMVFTVPTGVRLTSDTLVIPDLCFVSHSRRLDPSATTFDEAPDLIVEILSPGTRRRDLTIKRELYERFAVPEYWVVDPDARTITILALRDGRYEPVPLGDDGAVHSRVLPGLPLTLEQIFAGV